MPLNATFDTRRKRYKERNNQNLRLGESRCPSDVAHTCARGLCVGSGSLRTCASGHHATAYRSLSTSTTLSPFRPRSLPGKQGPVPVAGFAAGGGVAPSITMLLHYLILL